MARQPALHALYHSIASLGYIPFVLTSVLLSSSSPFVTISSINIILIAFVPPLALFPLLCFSYRYLEKFQAISLSIQRARIYIMLAGSGLCLLVAAHLMMVHLVGNMQNSLYHPIAPPPPPSMSAPNLPPALNSVTTVAAETQGPPSSSARMDPMDETPEATPTLIKSLLIPDFLEKALKVIDYLSDASTDQESIGTSPEHDPALGGTPASSTLTRRDVVADQPLFKTLVPTHLMHPTQPPPKLGSADGEANLKQPRERDLALQQSFAVEPMDAVPSSSSSSPSPSSKESVLIVDAPVSAPIDAQVSSTSSTSQTQPKKPLLLPLPPVDPISLLLLPSLPSPAPPPQDKSLPVPPSEHPGVERLFYNTRRMSPGYNLAGLHWVLFIAAQGFLILLLLSLFLGVLILTEYVLDREDEDLAQLKYHYWARVLGIGTATVLSALHGSLISGYVLLDGVSDWIAKATVAAICGYWVSMTWVMKRVTGPLPY